MVKRLLSQSKPTATVPYQPTQQQRDADRILQHTTSGRIYFLYEDHLDVIMAVIDVVMLRNDEELNLEINACIQNMPSKKKSNFQYEFCDKVGLASRVLKRHFTKKHPSSKAYETPSLGCLGLDLVSKAVMRLQPLTLKCLFEKSILQIGSR